MDPQKIIEGLKVVCQCQGIQHKTIVQRIAAGAHTLEALQQATGAGSGSCQGRQCTPKIEALLKALLK